MTINEIYKDYIENLNAVYDEREAINISDWVFENIAGIKKLDRILNRHQCLNNSIIDELSTKLNELLKHKPVQYVLQEAWFYKMKLFVNEHVLIPRPETEELVEWILNESENNNNVLKYIDIGTGSGCIAVALKKNLPKAEVLGIDISKAALTVARQNNLKLCESIEFLEIDFLNQQKWNQLSTFDVIVSNPPYISEDEKINLPKNVVDYEPHQALFTGNKDHLIFYKRIALFAESHLNKDGKIYVEVNENYAHEVKEIFTQHALSSLIKKDLYGRDRMIKASR